MKNLKLILTGSFLLFVAVLSVTSCSLPTNLNSQITDDQSCVKERLLTLNRNNNTQLFDSNDTTDVFTEIKHLVLDQKINLFNIDINQSLDVSTIYQNKIQDSIFYVSTYYNPYFEFMSEDISPLLDINGNDSLFNIDGEFYFVYPELEISPIKMADINEIKILETRTNDTSSINATFKPTYVGFDLFDFGHHLLFWVKLEELKHHMIINKKWVQDIDDQNYNGFTYYQMPCDDPIYSN